ncbi:MAG: ABC transporter permease [Dehalococcoidia bacterium]|nr:ABC transporter permease [Dehalococcoidia bacterium]MCA9824538.1 ABC transporter permease [Dehalococcoidia bacterium]MCA9843356.1 ABC transporter permease [Dehalococcoidia bacterium]MCA9853917.1 ABC transporter permease [Dehalococcoidia bacterium]
MTGYIVRRTLWIIPVLWAIATLTFFLMHAVEGGPFASEKPVPPRIEEALNAKYNLDKSLGEQYVLYFWDLLHLDLGTSFNANQITVRELLAQGLPISIQLGVVAFIYAVVVGGALGVIAALNQNRAGDYLGVFFATIGTAMPNFIMASFLVIIFSVKLGWFAVLGWGGPEWALDDPTTWARNFNPFAWDYTRVVLPVVALGTLAASYIARITRASMLEVLQQDYVRTARAKGLQERHVIARHTLKNAMVPILTVLGPIFVALVTGSFIVERIFAIPGIGRHFVTAIFTRDYGVIMGVTLFYALLVAVANLLIDISYAVVDPRIRYH